jgi:hypothetical protein
MWDYLGNRNLEYFNSLLSKEKESVDKRGNPTKRRETIDEDSGMAL